MAIEIELKFFLENPEKTIQALNEKAEPIKEDYQKDIYYLPVHRNFIEKKPVSEWLRIREAKNKSSINYKRWHNDKANAISCDEFETSIENIEHLKNILNRLDFKELIIVEKIRKNWKYKNTIISIDKITGLGHFIEIEIEKHEFEKIEKAKKYLYEILGELNLKLGKQDFEGYPYLLLKKKGLI
ncbi:class IV adenylate cyclase [Candidatus Pacearchaeota archaeon]|nr:class IV adenylate cyclase [Candidatus Pacearchaeota archaeon]